MPIKIIAHLPERAAQVRLVGDAQRLVIGRDAACDLQLPHPSISRHHALLQFRHEHWVLDDQDSKNGIRFNGTIVDSVSLSQPQWLQLGDIYLECEPVTETVAVRLRQRERQRRYDSQILERDFQTTHDLEELVQQGLRNLLTLANCERGFILLIEHGELRIHAREGLRMKDIAEARFEGSAGSVQRAIEEKRAIVCHDTRHTAWLRDRESVVSGDIGALVSVPLLASDRVIGAVYLDSRAPGRFFTELDLELIEAFTDRMATVITATGVNEDIADMHAELNPTPGSTHHAWEDVTVRHRLGRE